MLSHQSKFLCRRFSQNSGKFADIVVVGGGLVGSALACKLAKSQWLTSRKICLLESSPKKPAISQDVSNTPFSNRVVALNAGTQSLFESIGAWDLIPRKKPYNKMFVWDHCSPSSIEFKSSLEPIAHIIENDFVLNALDRVTDELVDKQDNLEVIYSASIKSCELPAKENEDDYARLTLDNGGIIEANLVIGADGANSMIRKSMKTNYSFKDYKQWGVVGTVTLEESETRHDIAFQKFMPTGPIALLPLCPGKMSLVWTLPTEKAKNAVKNLSPDELAEELNYNLNKVHTSSPLIDGINSSVGLLLRPFRDVDETAITSLPPPKVVEVTNAAMFPLAYGTSERYVGNRVALIGDAAHRVHPLAGQGVNLGYSDVQKLVKNLENNVAHGRKFPSYENLCDYETEAMRHNLPVTTAIDSLQQIYCTENPLFVAARSVGLQLVNSNSTLKNFIMSAAASSKIT